ncbi:type II toxin-antitoxin system VapC family toxin [Mycobacterium sp.]|uniref:type II toxin-antitoxin system VapC family toxin n=1 Tax=Mycobacterium sp. TaxID=1785 RepID=UPI001285F971|nr:type II toxin-antitoxin system VapC family toxin [Mycobacterium sp.]KAA8958683.1 MAG: type II toxin-antitoxin system VapC family toxin [Mycobacterium sp.]
MIVVDCAALVDALTGFEGAEELRADLADEELHAPTLLDFEVVSALRGLTLGGQLSTARAHDALTDFDALPIRRWSSSAALRLRAFTLRNNLSAYDAAYVALAEALECPILTRDTRLARSRGHNVEVRVR